MNGWAQHFKSYICHVVKSLFIICLYTLSAVSAAIAQTDEEVPENHYSFDNGKLFLNLSLQVNDKDIIGHMFNKTGEEFYLSGVYNSPGEGVFTLRPAATMEDMGIGFLHLSAREVRVEFSNPKTSKTGIPKKASFMQLGCCDKK